MWVFGAAILRVDIVFVGSGGGGAVEDIPRFALRFGLPPRLSLEISQNSRHPPVYEIIDLVAQ